VFIRAWDKKDAITTVIGIFMLASDNPKWDHANNPAEFVTLNLFQGLMALDDRINEILKLPRFIETIRVL